MSPVHYREVAGSNGLYRCGTDGSFYTRLPIKGGRNKKLLRRWRRVKPFMLGKYYGVSCRLPGSTKNKNSLLHRIILETFKGPCPPGMECCHRNGNKLDLQITNLEWETHTRNMKDCIRHGTSNIGERNPLAKLTWEDVDDIRSSFNFLECTIKGMAKFWKVSYYVIWRIIRNKGWEPKYRPK
jgi:hypothetical protein